MCPKVFVIKRLWLARCHFRVQTFPNILVHIAGYNIEADKSTPVVFNGFHVISFRRFALCRIGYKLSNQLESVDIKIKLAFSVQTFERNNYIRTFNVFDQINSWPGTKKDIACLFKAITAILPKAFTRFNTSALRTNPIQLAYGKLSSDGYNSFASDFSFHD